MEETLLIYITVPDRATARELSGTLLQERLAACANILDEIESRYWWHGKIQRTAECLCILKTTASRFAALEKRVLELHPYEIPCIAALPLTHGHAPFLRWIAEETQPGGPPLAESTTPLRTQGSR